MYTVLRTPDTPVLASFSTERVRLTTYSKLTVALSLGVLGVEPSSSFTVPVTVSVVGEVVVAAVNEQV